MSEIYLATTKEKLSIHCTFSYTRFYYYLPYLTSQVSKILRLYACSLVNPGVPYVIGDKNR